MENKSVIFTSVSWAGDFFLLWPVASWYYKTHNTKIHFVVSNEYYMYEVVKSFLELQPFCEKVTLVDVKSDAWNTDCWNFNPLDHGIEGKYYNFGFLPQITSMYMPAFYASLHNFGWDKEMKLTLPELSTIKVPNKVTIPIAHEQDGNWNRWRSIMPDDVVELSVKDSFELNAFKLYHAKERHLGTSALSVLTDLLDKDMTLYAYPGFNPNMYYKHQHHIIH